MEALLEQAKTYRRVSVASDTLASDERRKLTVAAGQLGLAVYKELDEVTRKPHLIITLSREEACDPAHLTPVHLKLLGDVCGVPLSDPATVLEDLALFGVADGAQLVTDFVDEVRRYGCSGLKRRDIILREEMEIALCERPEYKAFQEAPVPTLQGKLDLPMTIAKRIYQAANAGRLFFSIDLRAAIFQVYRSLGICQGADTWAEWVARFTPSPIVARNKFMRVRIFGSLDKSRTHAILWQNAIWDVYQRIVAAWPEADERRLAIEGDEIILSTTPDTIINDARHLLQDAGLAEQSATVKVRCYRLLPLTVDVSAASAPRNSHTINCFVRQDIDLATGEPSGAFDVKCVQGLFRKQAMLAARAHLVAK